MATPDGPTTITTLGTALAAATFAAPVGGHDEARQEQRCKQRDEQSSHDRWALPRRIWTSVVPRTPPYHTAPPLSRRYSDAREPVPVGTTASAPSGHAYASRPCRDQRPGDPAVTWIDAWNGSYRSIFVRAYHRRMPNRLAGETSPYLLQHAHNPVDWFPWGPEALARAKLLDRPIFLSIGYAACHWCHVMERESFEDEATARATSTTRFVAIKVDREERPDLDQIYMGAVQAMTGPGGWPMCVFLTPDGAPVLRRDLLPGPAAPRDAVVPPGAGGRAAGPGASSAPSVEQAGGSGSSARSSDAGAGRRAGRRPAVDAGAARRRGRGAVERGFDADERRLGRRAQVPAADDDRVPAPAARPRGDAGAADRDRRSRSTRWPPAASTTSSAAASTATRPTRIWLVPALRADALRQRPARPGLPARLGARPASARYREVATGRSTTCCAS